MMEFAAARPTAVGVAEGGVGEERCTSAAAGLAPMVVPTIASALVTTSSKRHTAAQSAVASKGISKGPSVMETALLGASEALVGLSLSSEGARKRKPSSLLGWPFTPTSAAAAVC